MEQALLSLLKKALIPSSLSHYLLKVSSTNTIILAIRISTCTFLGSENGGEDSFSVYILEKLM